MSTVNLHRRRCGLLLHPTSLPSGSLDNSVERWLRLLAGAGFSVWQVLPLGEPQAGLSPYQCTSAFAMNPALLPDYAPLDVDDKNFTDFCHQQQFWLDDYALFRVLKQQFDDRAWNNWPRPYRFRDSSTLQAANREHATAITLLKWQQYQLHRRWQDIRRQASALDILLFGDMPIYIGHDSADVWAHREQFLLDEEGNMEVVSGVPPDYFSPTGQRWGNPHYDWEQMQQDDFTWWKARINHHLQQFDLIRIDHFRGLEAAWMIDADCDTAVDGHWQKIPGDALLSSIRNMLNNNDGSALPFVAEDLGIITPEVTALRKKYRLPGIAVLQFGFDEFDDNPHKLKNISEDRVVYTGTHDNDTTKGWFNSLPDHVKGQVLHDLGLPHDDSVEAVVERMIEGALHSPACMSMIPVQDILHLGSEARMNIPGTTQDNWQWQLNWQQLEQLEDHDWQSHMRARIETAQRLPDTVPIKADHAATKAENLPY